MFTMPENNNSPKTMKDIAEAFNVSVATVSRALKDSPRISEKRREEIKAYARKHHFSPNLIAESLRSNKVMKVIGVIIPQYTHYYFSSVLSGIDEEARSRGYRLMVAQSEERYEQEVIYAVRSTTTKCAASLCRRPKAHRNIPISRN